MLIREDYTLDEDCAAYFQAEQSGGSRSNGTTSSSNIQAEQSGGSRSNSETTTSFNIHTGLYESYIELINTPSPPSDKDNLPPVNLWQLADESVMPVAASLTDDM